MSAMATFFCFIFRVRGRILRSVKAEWKNHKLILLCRWFSFSEKCLILGNFDTTIGKNAFGNNSSNRYLINKAKNHWNVRKNVVVFSNVHLSTMMGFMILSAVDAERVYM